MSRFYSMDETRKLNKLFDRHCCYDQHCGSGSGCLLCHEAGDNFNWAVQKLFDREGL